jgi:hypothetical protein
MVSVTNVGRPLKVLKPHYKFESCPGNKNQSAGHGIETRRMPLGIEFTLAQAHYLPSSFGGKVGNS